MVLTKDELIASLNNEIRILLHLASKVETSMLDYRPTPKQRALLELLQYLSIMAPTRLPATLANSFDMDGWRNALHANEIAAKARNLEQSIDAISKLPALFAEVLGPCSDEDLRAEIAMFGHKASRGSMIVSLVLLHLTAYRMQLFLYLKSCGRDELNTMNLWAGMDRP